MLNINWQLLAKAQLFYATAGFEYVEVPYHVSLKIDELTKPHRDLTFSLKNGLFYHKNQELVGSAEQSLLQLALGVDEDIPTGYSKQYPNAETIFFQGSQLMAITPCFRMEPHFDACHLDHFIKLELMHVIEYDRLDSDFSKIQADSKIAIFAEQALLKIINQCDLFYKSVLDPELKAHLELVETSDGFDINLNKIEIGSYGLRFHQYNNKFIYYAYGTGLALPRFTYASTINKL